MTTKRTYKARHLSVQVTPEAVEHFRIAEATTAVHLEHLRGTCGLHDRHCAACTRHIQASLALHRELHLRPWQASPVDATGEAPAWLDAAKRSDWREAQELRAALLDAAGLHDDKETRP